MLEVDNELNPACARGRDMVARATRCPNICCMEVIVEIKGIKKKDRREEWMTGRKRRYEQRATSRGGERVGILWTVFGFTTL